MGRKVNRQKVVFILGLGKFDSVRFIDFFYEEVPKYLFCRTLNPIEFNLRTLSNLNMTCYL